MPAVVETAQQDMCTSLLRLLRLLRLLLPLLLLLLLLLLPPSRVLEALGCS